ncbi:MAG TPA: RNA-binding domain-containing protein [Kofleriaceae bacterium]|nr:RNA-binding domain-containing protein [Kofleriaceae bacterium]
MTPDDLDILREGWDFEAKLAAGRDGQGAVPESLWETYSAMANTEGGVIVLGVKELPDSSLQLHGIPDIDKVERDFWNLLENRQKVSANLLHRDDVQRVDVNGRALLVIQVPKAPRSQRPVHLNGSWEKTYLRVHEGDRAVDREVARRMLADAQPDHDAQVLEGYSEADFHAESVRQYRQLLASQRPDHPFLRDDNTEFLQQIGAIGRDRLRKTEGVTLGGLMMLGREDAIRDRFPHWHLSYRELPADTAVGPRWLDRIAPDGTWNANVFEFYSRVILKLHQGLKVPFALDANQFRNDETPAHAAVREALVNTLIHADYEGRAGVRVLRGSSGYEFINPGLLLVTLDQVWRGGVSESRNPVLQRLFGLLQLGEREGSGGPAIRQAWAQQHWSAPNLWEEVELSETHLKLRQVSLLPQESVDAVRAWLGASFDTLDELGRLVLVTAHAERGFNHARLRDLTSAHPRDITLKLQDLVRKGFLVPSGNTRATTYRLAAGSEGSSASTEQVLLSSEESSSGSEQSSEQSSPGSEQSSDPRGWAAKDRQLEAVLAFCADHWRTLPEIALTLGRTENTVRTHYLRPLLAQGALEHRHPENPRHPHQAYRTVKRKR